MQWTKSGECPWPHDGLTMAEVWHLTWMTVLLCTKQQFYYTMSNKTSSTHLWNPLVDMTNESNFKKHLLEGFLSINASRKHFSISTTF